MTADEFKTIRIALGLSQSKLASRLGVSVRSLQKWEQGERKVGGMLHKIMMRMKGRIKKGKDDEGVNSPPAVGVVHSNGPEENRKQIVEDLIPRSFGYPCGEEPKGT